MSGTRGLRRTSLLVAALGALVVVTACGSGGGGGGDDGGDGRTIRIAYQAFPSGDLIVKEKGLLEKALPDHTIKWIKFDSGATINTAFVAGSVDLAAIGSSPVARGLSEPLNIPYKVTWVLDVAGDNEALVARDGSGVEDVEDLAGRKVATPFSSTSHYSLLAALDRSGVDASKVQLLDLEPQDIVAAWSRGDIDAAYVWLPTLDELGKTGKTLVSSRELAAAGKPTLDLGVASTAFIEKQPEVITAWRKAQAQALDLIHDDPSAAAEAVGRQLGISPQDAAAQLKQGIFLKPADQSDAKWLGRPGRVGGLAENLRSAAEFLAGQKQIPAAPELTELEKAVYVEGLSDAVTG
ncbi:ABC transporter substrate-binding protein [Streptomyces clavifer]|uniref:taurine ABC transporter substrate-binding protein n=1 Tax=Streptomyces TaxID=1883 RepID=UPI0006F9D659|nr:MULTISPECIES: ABC transporter substrate-binding protein [unclassified Streptomyces]KQX89664.1 glycine/betaine ABC transporter substrate-binding protein [Streptomyces sp. Root1319]KQZ20646.1 glycine/betaine ABC transporter substrate-binding protein [Streptomyces sp. Root55]MDX3061769.1 ABC transporter substrate-binding protein [Streptomyces sp. ND04-05B]